MADYSVSTAGGTNFDNLANGTVKGYSFWLVDLAEKSFKNAKAALLEHITKVISALEIGTDKKVKSFYIGKTCVLKRDKARFNYMNHNTWKKKEGISNRWYNKYSPDKCDGLVVLACVTRTMLSDEILNAGWTQQHYALALESSLINHFIFEDFDCRLKNNSLSTGQLTRDTNIGYVVYIAYQFEETSCSMS